MKSNWTFDYSHSRIGFSVKHFGITETDGFFRKFEGTITGNQDDFSDMAIELMVSVESIDTNDPQRDAHLKNADFFDVEKYPSMTFKSTSVEKLDSQNLRLHGNLTMKDITRPVSLDVEFAGIVPRDPFGNTKAGFLVTAKINRKDWGITWNAALDHGGVAVGEQVKIVCPVQLLKVK